MTPLYVLNDTHAGVIRGGTTIKTAYDLRGFVLDRMQQLLDAAFGGDLLINGDLFDTFNIPYTDFFKVYEMLTGWLVSGKVCKLYLGRGNHDVSKTTANMSSFDLLGKLLKMTHAQRVHVITEPFLIPGRDAYVIPHMVNQDLFDLALKEVPKVKYLFLHCNYDNKFAEQSDHSLNLSSEQAAALPVDHIILGHEHQRKSALAGKVIIVGNQIPTSVADCLGNDAKYMLRILSDKIEHVCVWEAKGSFERIDWNECMKAASTSQFIRVEGSCGEAEAAGMLSRVAKLRQVHGAFVITNAVKIAGADDKAANRMSLEQIQSFNVLDALLKKLNPEQQAVVRKLVEKIDVATP